MNYRQCGANKKGKEKNDKHTQPGGRNPCPRRSVPGVGVGTNESIIRGGSVPGCEALPFYKPFLRDKVAPFTHRRCRRPGFVSSPINHIFT